MLNINELMGAGLAEVIPVALITDEPSQPVALTDILESISPIITGLPGVTPELLKEVYGWEVPEHYTQANFSIAALAYVMALLDRDGYCILYNWPAWVYHSLPFISSTLLKAYASLPSTSRVPFCPGDDANVGSGCHAYSLQGQSGLDAECFILPAECEGKSIKAIEARNHHINLNPGMIPLPYQYGPLKIPIMDVLQGMNDSLNDHPKIGPVLRNSQKELSLVWIDEDSGCFCKSRLDIWESAEQTLWDIKKVRKITGLKWEMDGGLFYRLQAGIYFNGAIACGLDPVAFGFIAIEAFPPFECRAFYSDPEKTAMAQEEVKRLIGLVKQSQLEDYWPNFPPPIGLYNWHDMQPDDLIEVL